MKKDITKNDLRLFGITLSIILFVIGSVQLYKGNRDIYPWFYISGGLILTLTIFAVSAIRQVYFIFSKVGHAIGWVNTKVILIVIFFIVLTPIALILRLLKKDFLQINWRKKSSTYWITTEKQSKEIGRYEQQF